MGNFRDQFSGRDFRDDCGRRDERRDEREGTNVVLTPQRAAQGRFL